MNDVAMDYTPTISEISGLRMAPPRPPAVADPALIPGYTAALADLTNANRALLELRGRLAGHEATVAAMVAQRVELVRKARLGEEIKSGAAAAVDRKRQDAASEADLTRDALAVAERDVVMFRKKLRNVLRDEAARYLARLRIAANEARERYAIVKHEFDAKEFWAMDLMGVLQSQLELEDLIIILGI